MIDLFRKAFRYFWRKEVLLYLIFGVLTTLVNLGIYFLCAKVFSIDEVVSNALAWMGSVVFAFITNKIWVFESRGKSRREVMREAVSFFGFRAVSGVIDVGVFALLVKVFLWNDAIVKIGLQIIITVMNYLFSKVFVFRKDKR